MTAAWWANVVLWQGLQAAFGGGAPLPSLPAPHIVIADNTMSGTNIAGGVYVEDDSPLSNLPNRLDAAITGNHINLNNDGADGGVDGFYARGISVMNNHISGIGLAGVDVGTPYIPAYPYPIEPAGNWRIIGNDLSGLTASTDQGGPGAQIWLGPGANHCLVIGGPPPTTVLDQGTDDTLINVTPVSDPPAAAATPMNALRQFRQLKGMVLH